MTFLIDKDFALLYGIMLGDGCLSLIKGKKKFISITGSSENDLPFFEKVIHPILFKLRGKKTNIKFRKGCKAIEFNFADKNLFDFIAFFGFPIGKKLDRLFIPEVFYEKKLVERVIAGFFATDGSLVLTKNPNKYYPRLEAHVISISLLEEIFRYLSFLGMRGALYKCKRNTAPGEFNSRKRYRFQFNGKSNLILFQEKVGFVNPYYYSRFLNFIQYSDYYGEVLSNNEKREFSQTYKKVNSDFDSKMTLGRLELPISACLKS